MSRKVKELMVEEFTDRFSSITDNGCVVVGFNQISADEATEVRETLSEKNASMMVVRNSLMALSLEELEMPELKEFLDGPTAFVMGDEPVETAKAVEEAAEDSEGLSIKGGFAEGRMLEAEGVKNLASLPDRKTLLGQTLMCMTSPAKGFVNGINQTFYRFVNVLNELKEKREKAE